MAQLANSMQGIHAEMVRGIRGPMPGHIFAPFGNDVVSDLCPGHKSHF